MHFTLVNLFLLLAVLQRSIDAAEWNYGDEGPDVWSDTYPACAGYSQSPINIDTTSTMHLSFTPFKFTSAYNLSQNFTLTNNGHTIVAVYSGKDSPDISFQGGGLVGTYGLYSFHLHWGENYKSGSEHQVDGGKYTAEMHFVHYNPVLNKYAVLGMFIQSVKDANSTHATRRRRETSTPANSTSENWAKYLTESGQLNTINESVEISLNLASLFSADTEHYWRYMGSLTTPSCTEGIIWTLFREPIILEDSYFQYLRSHIFAKGFRGPQRLYGRNVYRSYLEEESSAAADSFNFLKSYFYLISCLVFYLYMHL